MPMITSTLTPISTIYLGLHLMFHNSPWRQKSTLSLIKPNKAGNNLHVSNLPVRALLNLKELHKPALPNPNHQGNQKVQEVNKQTSIKELQCNINLILRRARKAQRDAQWEIRRVICPCIATKVRKVIKILSGALSVAWEAKVDRV